MKKIINRIPVLLSAMLLLTIASCQDDHFDTNPDVNARLTIWQQIKKNDKLSEFAYILENTRYSKSENSQTNTTYAELLDHDQIFTVWAPVNGSFDFNLYKALLASGNRESAYRVEKELIRNNMARFSFVLNGSWDEKEINLFNDKTADFVFADNTIGGVKVTTANIGCTNGTLHITEAAVPFRANLYELIGTLEDCDSIYRFIKGYEKFDFDQNASTQGPTVLGNITWVDSVTHLSNEYFWSMGAYLNREDSLYAMIVPNNTAWRSVIDKTRTYYNFMPEYTQTVTTVDADGNESTEKITTTFTQAELDSMLNLYSKSAICNNLVFNARYQFKKFNPFLPWDCDSLQSTSGNKFKVPYVEPLFAGVSDYHSASNGYAYVVDQFNYRPQDTWAKEKQIEAEYGSAVESYSHCTPTSYTGTFERNDSIIKYSVVRTVQSSSSVNPDITFKIMNTLSCKYDIYLIMAWNKNAEKPALFKALLNYHDGKKAMSKSEVLAPEQSDTLHYGGKNLFTNRPPVTDSLGNIIQVTDTIPLAKDFEFPVSYYGMNNAYVTLKITSTITSKQASLYAREMWIDKIVFVAKEN